MMSNNFFKSIIFMALFICQLAAMDQNDKAFFQVKQGNLEHLITALNQGLNPNIKNNGKTLLHVAALADTNSKKMCKLLISKGVMVDAQDHELYTPLIYAIIAGNEKTVRLLIEKGADLNRNPDSGSLNFILQLAVQKGFPKVLKVLLEFLPRSQINMAVFPNGQTLLHGAAINGHLTIVAILINNGAEIEALSGHETPLVSAIQFLEFECAQYLLLRKANANGIDPAHPPLFYAISKRKPEFVTLLLSFKANINFTLPDTGYSALILSLLNCDESMAILLLKQGADPHHTDNKGFTALHAAAQTGLTKIIKKLLKKQASINATNCDGITPLYSASDHNKPNAVCLLLKRGADQSQKTSNGTTALDIALQKNNSCIEILRAHTKTSDILES